MGDYGDQPFTYQQATPERTHSTHSPTTPTGDSRVAIPGRQDSLGGAKSAVRRTSDPNLNQLRSFGYVPEIKSIGEARVVVVGDAEHLEAKAEVVTVEHLLKPSYAVVSPGIELTEAIGGLVGEIGTASPMSPARSPAVSTPERAESPLKTVKFGEVQDGPPPARIVKFQDETDGSDARSSSPTPAAQRVGEQKSILKVKTGPHEIAIDQAALMAVWSDSGSDNDGENSEAEDGSESYEVDDEKGSMSEESDAEGGAKGRDIVDQKVDKGWRRRRDAEDDADVGEDDLSEEHESDVDVEDDDEEPLGEKLRAEEEQNGNDESGEAPVLENVTLEDYDDMDGLLDILDKYIKRNRFSRALSGAPLPDIANLTTSTKRPDWLEGVVESASDSRSSEDASRSSRGKEREDDLETKQAKARAIMAKLNEANITTRIYIEDARTFKTLLLTSLMSADQIIEDVVTKFHLDVSPDWTLFELCNDYGVERPLRDWEIVTDVISAWDATTSINAIVMKKYAYRDTLSPRSLAGRYPRVQGWMYMEMKPGKWNRRFFVLRDSNIYYYKDANNGSSETLFCSLASYDIYTLSQRRKKSPTQFCFALRSTNSVTYFENKEDYVKFLCVEKQERLYDWVLALRLAKSEKTFEDFPEMFEDYDLSSKARRRRGVKARTAWSPTRGRQDVDEHKGRRALSPVAGEPLLKFAPSELSQSSQPTRRPTVHTKVRKDPNEEVLSPSEKEGLKRSNTRGHRRLIDDELLSPSNSEREDAERRRRNRTLLNVTTEEVISPSESDVPKRSRPRRGIETPEEALSPSEREGDNYFQTRQRSGDVVTSPKPLLTFDDHPGGTDARDREREREKERERERERRRGREEREREHARREGGEGNSRNGGGDRDRERERERRREREKEDPERHRRRSEKEREGSHLERSKSSASSSASRHHHHLSSSSRHPSSSGSQHHSSSSSSRHREKGSSTSTSAKLAGPKPLIDISDSMNCRKCGCSEYRGKGRGDERCTNCYHVHRE
ncbi:hypothetical protein HDV00_001654 [Rhizophlyctis rosea]|nr:hypothetical protein HDV00_001654 [Rhizophlyctis rosea]